MSYPDPDEVICGEISSAVKLISHSFLPIAVIYVLACLVVTSIEEEEEEEEEVQPTEDKLCCEHFKTFQSLTFVISVYRLVKRS